jgi:hypothetical protein
MMPILADSSFATGEQREQHKSHCNNSKSTPTTTGDKTEQHIQLKGTKKKEQGESKQILIPQKARRINSRVDKKDIRRQLGSILAAT